MIIVIGGTPGSGKTTVVDIIAQQQRLLTISSGQMFRDEAKHRGMTLAEFGAYAQKHHNVDEELDRMVTKMVLQKRASEDLIVDSRLQAYLLRREDIELFAAHIDAPLGVRAERIAGREAKQVKQVMMEIQEREKSERNRYLTIYGIDITDMSVYDMVVDSGEKTAQQVADIIWSQVPR